MGLKSDRLEIGFSIYQGATGYNFLKNVVFHSLKVDFVSANSTYMAYPLGLHYLPNKLCGFAGLQRL